MSDELISGHKKIAMEGLGGLGSVESPFKNGPDHGKPSRGELKDSQRKACNKAEYSNDHDGDDD